MTRVLEFSMPVRVVSEANQREHWRAKHERKKRQQAALQETLVSANVVTLPCVVRLTRIGPRRLDTDNLAGSFKHVQDEIARYIGVDDGDERITWEYAQEAVGKRVYAVKVEVYCAEANND